MLKTFSGQSLKYWWPLDGGIQFEAYFLLKRKYDNWNPVWYGTTGTPYNFIDLKTYFKGYELKISYNGSYNMNGILQFCQYRIEFWAVDLVHSFWYILIEASLSVL